VIGMLVSSAEWSDGSKEREW